MNTQARRLPTFFAFTVTLALAMTSASMTAQSQTSEPVLPPQFVAASTAPSLFLPETTSSSSALPDAPSAMAAEDTGISAQPAANTPHTPWKYAKFIPQGAAVQPMSAGDKFKMSLVQMVSPLSLAGSVISAGYSHATNGQPNYGTNGEAFGKRVGASFARGSSQELFSDGIVAPILHMDPRYYIAGSSKKFIPRVWYAATRVLISKTDSGRSTINAPLLIGYAGAAGLNYAYYPEINKNFKDTATGYGGSIGGAALGFIVSEFADDFLRSIHLRAK